MNHNSEKTNDALLKVTDLKTYFAVKAGLFGRPAGYIKAVDGVSFEIRRGQAFGLVGESGCGKTSLARTIVRLVPATAGSVTFDGLDVLCASGRQLKRFRREVALIFQDPFASLNPRLTVGAIIGEPLQVHTGIGGSELSDRIMTLLRQVGLAPADMNRYPHEFSGGQRQRIGIARALACRPRLIIADEPLGALDASIQSQILNLLKDLQEQLGLAFLFIAHNLAVVEFFCDVAAVMYAGRIVELADAKALCRGAVHPYTRLLASAVPRLD